MKFRESSVCWTTVCCCCCLVAQSRTTLQPRILQPARLHSPCDFPGENIGAVWHFLAQGIFPTQGSNLCHLQYHWATWEAQTTVYLTTEWGAQLGDQWWPEGVGWGVRREAQEGGDIHITHSLRCAAETNAMLWSNHAPKKSQTRQEKYKGESLEMIIIFKKSNCLERKYKMGMMSTATMALGVCWNYLRKSAVNAWSPGPKWSPTCASKG